MMLPIEHYGGVYQQHQAGQTRENQVLNQCTNKAYTRVSAKYGYMSDDKKKRAVYGMTIEMIAQELVKIPEELVQKRIDEVFKQIQ